ncbi:MAG: nucleotidyltransferase family protein [Bacteroidaceae bacterium]|nr:nucleotidyltransferase family protein [Bacteroidaceae bacterium]
MKQAMIFAAGLGTRLKPLTDTMPKALVPVGGQPLLEHIILKLKAAGFERIVVNVHHFGQQIIDYLAAHDHFGLDIRISDERAELLETGGGLKHARALFDPSSPILIHNVDILSDLDLAALYGAAGALGSAALAISRRESASGRYLLFDADRHLIGWTSECTGEVRSPYDDALARTALRAPFAGIHAFHPSLFPLMDAWPERFYIIDFYLSICRDHVIGGHLDHFRLIDVGKLDSLAEAETFLRQISPQ